MNTNTQESGFELTNTQLHIAARRVFDALIAASEAGGFWVSAAGGTANVMAGEFAKVTGCDYEVAHVVLAGVGKELFGEDWYQQLADMQPSRFMEDEEIPPFDVQTLVERTATTAVNHFKSLAAAKTTMADVWPK